MKTWQECLAEAEFPPTVLVLDFETFYSPECHMGKDAKALSICEYVHDPRFEILGFGLKVLGHRWEGLGTRFIPQPRVQDVMDKLTKEFGKSLHNVTIVSYNAKFDMLILAEKFHLFPPFTVDVMDLTRTFDARMSQKLRDTAPLFGLQNKGETSQFKGQHFGDLDQKALADYCLNDVNLEASLFKHLLPIVVDPKKELFLAAHTLRLYIRPELHFDFDLAVKLRADMQDQIDAAVKDVADCVMQRIGMLETDRAEAQELDCWREIVQPILSGDISFAKLLSGAMPEGERLPTKPGKPSENMIPITGTGRIPAFAKDDDGCKDLLNHKDSMVRTLMTARMAVSSWPGHIGRIDNLVSQAKASWGLVRVPLKYYGCHTGRWSGEESVNLGNLGGSGRGKAVNKLIGQVRHTLHAAPGCMLVLVDSAQIEARNVAWYAGQEDLLTEFRDKGDPYSSLATDLFKTKVWKWKPDDIEEYPGQEKKIAIYRGFGKDAVLGCGFGMGAAKFYARCLANDELRPHFDSGEYTEETTARVVATYRTKYSCIPKFWSAVERAWRVATKFKREETVGPLAFWHKDGTTFMRLPSGRIMRYRHASVDANDNLKWHWGTLWGGSITENIVQATCRDMLRDWIYIAVREEKLCVVHHVYDEIIVQVGENRAEETARVLSGIMQTCPSWAEGMPLGTDVKIKPYYTK
jgi:hypothetical protein